MRRASKLEAARQNRRKAARPPWPSPSPRNAARRWIDGEGYELLLQEARELRCDVLAVIGNDRLYSLLVSYASSAPPPAPYVIKLARSEGVITRGVAMRQAAQSRRIHEYLYGALGRELFPHSLTLDFGAVNVFSIGVARQAPASALPMGMQVQVRVGPPPNFLWRRARRRVSSTPTLSDAAPPSRPRLAQEDQLAAKQLPPFQFAALAHSLLALVHAESGHADHLLAANAAGFVWVSAVDQEKQKITLLAPAPLAAGQQVLLLAGSVKWSQEANK